MLLLLDAVEIEIRLKRPMMTREALKFSDKVIVTDDIQEMKNPKKIRNQMIHGLSENEKNIKIIADRKAIFFFKIINKRFFNYSWQRS